MGKAADKRKITLYRQIALYFIRIISFTLITSLTLMLISYFIYHSFAGFQSFELNNTNIINIMEFTDKNSNEIIDGGLTQELDNLVSGYGLDYYIKDTQNKVIYDSAREKTSGKQRGYFTKLIREMVDNTLNPSTAELPLFDRDTGKVSRILVLTHNNTTFMLLFIFIDVCIPLICFIISIAIFSRSLGSNLKKPLEELMSAVEKIKIRDLEFTLDSRCNNEIGDLITAFEEMRINLKESLIREWQLEQDRRDMVAAITHDLRTPLAIIQGHVEGLRDGLLEDKTKLEAYLNIIYQNSLRAKILIDDMNSLVEIDSSGFELHRKEEDLPKFLSNTIDEIKILTASKGINVVADLADCRTENTLVLIDGKRLSQVIDNIVGNSIRFTPEGGSIYLKMNIGEQEAYFTISDTGCGFSEKDFQKLFGKFYKGDDSRSKEKGHSGLGLYIAGSIIGHYGGTIEATNLPEGGACVSFSIKY